MNEVVLNNELTLAYPEDFDEMTEIESYQVFGMDTPDRWSIWNKERDAIISLQCNESKAPRFRKAPDAHDLAQNAEKATAKAYEDAGYSAEGIESRELCGCASWGFSFDYVDEDAPRMGRIDIFMHPTEKGSCCYTIYLASGKQNAADNLAIYEQVLASMVLE